MRVCRGWRRSIQRRRSDRARQTTGTTSGAPPVVARRSRRSRAIGRGAGSRGRVRPPWLGVQTGGGNPAPGRAGRRCRQAETLAVDRGGGRPWRCSRGGGSRDPDASEAAGPRHQAALSRRSNPLQPGALGEDRGARPGEPGRPGCAFTLRERTASGPIERSRRAAPATPPPKRRTRRSAVAVGRPGGDAGRFGGQSAEAGREPRLDGMVADSAGAGPAGDGRGEG